jgi:hypothetical protein
MGFSTMIAGQGRFSPYAYTSHEDIVRKNEDERFEELTNKLEEFFKTYIIISCAGEARYAWSMIDDGIKALPEWLPVREIIKNNPARQGMWRYAHWLLSQRSCSEMAVDLVHIFGLKWMTSAYGGAKWQSIAQHLMDYLSGKMSKMIFVDQAVSLCHNGNIFLDKLYIDIYSTKCILDYKLEATEENFLGLKRYMVEEDAKRYSYLKDGKDDGNNL